MLSMLVQLIVWWIKWVERGIKFKHAVQLQQAFLTLSEYAKGKRALHLLYVCWEQWKIHYICTLWIIFSFWMAGKKGQETMKHKWHQWHIFTNRISNSMTTTLLLIAYSYYMFVRMWKYILFTKNCYQCHKTYPRHDAYTQNFDLKKKERRKRRYSYAWFFNRKLWTKCFFFLVILGY